MTHDKSQAEPLKIIKHFYLIEAYMGQNVCDTHMFSL